MIVSILVVAVISTACINNIAVQELNNKAAEYMDKGDYEAAVNRLQASLDLDSTMYQTYYNLGIAALKAKKYETSINALQDGIKIKSDYADFYYSLGAAQAEYAEAIIAGEENNNETEENVKIEDISPADKAKAIEYKRVAIENLSKYLEMVPNSPDKAKIEEIISELNKDLEENSDKV